MRDSMVIYRSFYEAAKNLPDNDFCTCMRVIFDYGFDDIEPTVGGIADFFFKMAKPQIDANNRKYKNGKKGGRPPENNQSETKPEPENNQSETKPEPENNQSETKPEPNVNVNDNVNVNVNGNVNVDDVNANVNVDDVNANVNANGNGNVSKQGLESKEKNIKKERRFKPPTVDEVEAYCFERGNGIDPEQFVDYYTARGWMIGKGKMKDWKAAVRTWEKNNHGSSQVAYRTPGVGGIDWGNA